jgi:hypothetical protein
VSSRDELALEHAWRYFALHSEQRTTVFNFFAAAAGLTLSGLAYVLGSKGAPAQFGVAAGIGAVLLALVFWKLDQRVAHLTKCAEQVIVQLEIGMLPDAHRMFSMADALPVNGSRSPLRGTWSYGRSFRILFAGVAILGLSGAAINGCALLKEAAIGTKVAGDSVKPPVTPSTTRGSAASTTTDSVTHSKSKALTRKADLPPGKL